MNSSKPDPGLGRRRDAIFAEDAAIGHNLYCPTDAELVEPRDVVRLHAEGADLIDLRPPEAFAVRHLPGAINIPVDALIALSARTRGAVILYDDDGSLVARRCEPLREAVGEMEFFVLAGGLRAWTDAGLPVEER